MLCQYTSISYLVQTKYSKSRAVCQFLRRWCRQPHAALLSYREILVDKNVQNVIFNFMVKYYADTLDATFKALSDSTRRKILMRLAEDECTVSELAEPFDMSLPAISKHLRILENASLIVRRKQGRMHKFQVDTAPMRDVIAWIEKHRKFWERRFDALEKYLEESGGKEEK